MNSRNLSIVSRWGGRLSRLNLFSFDFLFKILLGDFNKFHSKKQNIEKGHIIQVENFVTKQEGRRKVPAKMSVERNKFPSCHEALEVKLQAGVDKDIYIIKCSSSFP